ncbi:MAG: anthranilate synthase component 1 [Buchnera aphidicola (Chaetogeoica yunlongensis)]
MKKKLIELNTFKVNTCYQPNPTVIFNQLCKHKSETLLLESAEVDKKCNVESMMIIDTALRISILYNIVTLQAFTKNGISLLSVFKSLLPKCVMILSDKNPLKIKFPFFSSNLDEDQRLKSLSIFDAIRLLIKSVKNISNNELKSMFFGGFFSYDLITNFENLPILKSDQNCPDLCFYISEVLLVLDHKRRTSVLQVSLFTDDSFERTRLKNRSIELKNKLNKKLSSIQFCKLQNMILKYDISDKEYNDIVVNMKKSILNGEVFQVVPSRRFYLPCVNPLLSYDFLKKNNPSPYMFFMQDRDFTLFGASPESALKYDSFSKKVEIYPIAGTRPRGRDSDGLLDLDLDSRIELEMRTNHKELSEHLMLVDLARNDLAKICKPGTRYIADLIKVDRYSHVMHLVSRVVGLLREDLDFLHAYQSCMNMGTLTGAPKIRAMELIASVERKKRGSYGGAIGYFTGLGTLDTCIIIRSAYVENNIAVIQSGAGIVLDSIPQLESDECKYKAQAVFQAIFDSHTHCAI